MTTFRNVLVVCGAILGSAWVVDFLRWGLLLPIAGIGVGGASTGSAYAWAIATVIFYGVLAGAITAVAFQGDRLGWWPLLILAVAWLGAPSTASRRPFPTPFSHALAEFVVSALGAAVLVTTFLLGRSRMRERARVVNAR